MRYFIELHNLNHKTLSKSKLFKKIRSKNGSLLYGNTHEFDFNVNIKKNTDYILKLYKGSKHLGEIKFDYFDIEAEMKLFANDGYIEMYTIIVLIQILSIIILHFIIYTNIYQLS